MQNKIPTLKEVAGILGVSISTVSRALQNNPAIGKHTTERVHKLVKELGYEVNKSAVLFNQSKTCTIGVIVPNFSEPFFASALTAIEAIAGQHDYNVFIGQSLDSFEREVRLVKNMKEHRVDGLLISLTKQTATFEHLDSLQKLNIPVVFFDRVPARKDIHYVACNLFPGMLKAFTKLVQLGHKRVGLINGPPKLSASVQRAGIYFRCLSEMNLPVDQDIMVSTTLEKADNIKAINRLLDLPDRPTAVVVFNDYVVLDCIAAAKQRGLIVNRDISFISFANLPVWEYMDTLPLVSIEQFAGRQASTAAGFLFGLIQQLRDDITGEVQYMQHIIDSEMVDYAGTR